jgi:hypothetical protein
MIRNLMVAAVASAAVAVASPALAKPGGGAGAGANVNAGAGMSGGPSQTAIESRINSQGAINASPNGIANSNANSALSGTTTITPPTVRATNSQGLLNASPNAIGRASSSSVLARSAVPATALPGLTTGLTVQTTGGAALGTVSQVVTGRDGSVRLVVVTSPTGQTYRLAPTTLNVSGGVVTTTTGG